MIKFGGKTKAGEPIIGIGLSRENCRRLCNGEPIRFDLSELYPNRKDVVIIVGGDDEVRIAQEVRAGLVRGID